MLWHEINTHTDRYRDRGEHKVGQVELLHPPSGLQSTCGGTMLLLQGVDGKVTRVVQRQPCRRIYVYIQLHFNILIISGYNCHET